MFNRTSFMHLLIIISLVAAPALAFNNRETIGFKQRDRNVTPSEKRTFMESVSNSAKEVADAQKTLQDLQEELKEAIIQLNVSNQQTQVALEQMATYLGQMAKQSADSNKKVERLLQQQLQEQKRFNAIVTKQ